MAPVRTLSCPNCNAPLPPGARGAVTCEYCGHAFEVAKPPPATTPVAPRHQIPGGINVPIQIPTGTPPAKRGLLGALIAVSVLLLVGGLITAAVLSKRGQQAAHRASRGGYSPSGESLQWDSRGAFAIADLDGDPVEDFVGQYRSRNNGSTQVYVGGFAGKSLTRVWKAGPYGDNGSELRFAVAGHRVVVADAGANLHVLDLKTGSELRALRLSDRAESLCPLPEGSTVWIEVKDEQHVEVDLDTGALARAPRPDLCSSYKWASDCWHLDEFRGDHARARCYPPETAPEIPGFAAKVVLGDGQRYVVLGKKAPGTSIPMIAGAPVAGDATADRPAPGPLAWSRNLGEGLKDRAPEIADLVADRLVVVQENAGKGWRLFAIDPDTGDSRWEVPVPRSEQGSGPYYLVATPSRIYVPHWTWLDIFQAATGKHVGTIGIF